MQSGAWTPEEILAPLFNYAMKNQPFLQRVRFAISGVRNTFQSESSFRSQCIFAILAYLLLLATRAKPIWWALITLSVAAVLATELLNTALERIIDRLHPEKHPLIGQAKDCAAGAVIIFSLANLGIAAALIWNFLKD